MIFFMLRQMPDLQVFPAHSFRICVFYEIGALALKLEETPKITPLKH
jgi:hypothetical protein